MGLPELQNLVKTRQLKEEPPAAGELAGLIRSGQARLRDAANTSLHLESRFDLAYNAAHSLALAALRWHGFRSENRYVVFQALSHTVGLEATDWRVLDLAHRKRNLAEYEGELDIDEALLNALLRVAGEVARRVVALGPAQV